MYDGRYIHRKYHVIHFFSPKTCYYHLPVLVRAVETRCIANTQHSSSSTRSIAMVRFAPATKNARRASIEQRKEGFCSTHFLWIPQYHNNEARRGREPSALSCASLSLWSLDQRYGKVGTKQVQEDMAMQHQSPPSISKTEQSNGRIFHVLRLINCFSLR